jgi:hypothetical protein
VTILLEMLIVTVGAHLLLAGAAYIFNEYGVDACIGIVISVPFILIPIMARL